MPTDPLGKANLSNPKYCSESSGDSRNGFSGLELGQKQLMNYVPHRNPAELRASRHRGARRSAWQAWLSEQYLGLDKFDLPKGSVVKFSAIE